ncbi:MAG TPA: PsiF family protein [Casimicrobiaceae bacterium]|nr:PsiF family protein [Casimicrobiaceae bacterium]
MVKILFAFAAAAALLCATPTFAADTKSADTSKASTSSNSQQDKMKACNDQAGDKKGDERKAFMKTCLSAKPAEPPKAESKMAMCNKKTAGMKADERAKAQSECMKGS